MNSTSTHYQARNLTSLPTISDIQPNPVKCPSLISQINLVLSSSSSHCLSSDQNLSHLAYHSVSNPVSPQGSHKHVSVDATQVRPLPWLKSFNSSLFGGRVKMKCKDLLTKLAYLSSLTFCRPLLELLPLIQCTTYNSQTQSLFFTLSSLNS